MISPILQDIRAFELARVLPLIPAHSRVLEIGAGAGWQARTLSLAGHSVSAIDLPGGKYSGFAVFPIAEYDGRKLPFADASFDAVFSSNVLEHVPHIEDMLGEIRRVLRPEGVAVLVLPTPTWRFWTTLAHYPAVLRRIMWRLFPRHKGTDNLRAAPEIPSRESVSVGKKLAAYIVPHRHGVRGNFISEMFYFSRYFWIPVFLRAGFQVEHRFSAGLYYSGASLASDCLSVRARSALSRVLGSSCMVYSLRPIEQR